MLSCEVDFFYKRKVNMDKLSVFERGNEFEGLVQSALFQVVSDVKAGDLAAIEELLRFVPAEILQGFLSEVD